MVQSWSGLLVFGALLSLLLSLHHQSIVVKAWKSRECPIDSQDNRESYYCIRPCDYEESDLPEGTTTLNRNQHSREAKTESASSTNTATDESFFVVFFPPKNVHYEAFRFKCPADFKQTNENGQCFCERPYTPYELEMQRREKCDQSFERCRMYGSKPYDCNHIIESCPSSLIREYCLAGKVFKMRFARVVYEFCHSFLRLPNDGRNHLLRPNIDRKKH